MIRINVFIQVSDAHRAELLEAAKNLVANSVKEEGCIAYDIFESCTRPDVLMICETWADDSALAAHEKSTHFSVNVEIMQKLGALKIEKFNF